MAILGMVGVKHRIDYRHIIDWLVRKLDAFENYRYRTDLFPTSWCPLAYDALREEQGPKPVLNSIWRSCR